MTVVRGVSPFTKGTDSVDPGRSASIALPVHTRQAVNPDPPARRPSVQFRPDQKGSTPTKPDLNRTRSGSGSRLSRRLSSPPPPPVFQARVGFDTWQQKEETAFTQVRKHKDYVYTKRSRTFLCGLDNNDYSDYALEWLIDELVDDGDEVVCLRVVDASSDVATSSKRKYRDEADILMRTIEDKNHENKAINLILEFAVGKVEKVFTNMIKLYEPAILIVGTRGRSLGGFQGLLPGSISKFCLQNSPVPVIVVRPNTQRARGKRKRMQDPARQGYRDLLDKTGPEGGHILDSSNRNSVALEGLPATHDEASAVAAALGIRRVDTADLRSFGKEQGQQSGHPLSKVQSAGTDITSAESEGDRSPDGVRVLKSPAMLNLDSPELTGDEFENEPDIEAIESPAISPNSGGVQLGHQQSNAADGISTSLAAAKINEQNPGGPEDEPPIESSLAMKTLGKTDEAHQ